MIVCCECGDPPRPTVDRRVGKADPTRVYLCPRCRGRRAGKVNREKLARHGATYFDRRGEVGRNAR